MGRSKQRKDTITMKNAQIALVAAALMGVAGAAAGQTEELVRSIPMEPGGRFTLRNVEGGITVTGVDGDDLTIGRRSGRAAAGATTTRWIGSRSRSRSEATG